MLKKILYSILIFLMAFIIRAYVIPHLHHVYYDEFYYLNIAENIHYHNIASGTAMGDKNNIDITEVPIRPSGYPFVLSLAFKLFGDSEETVFQTNVFLGALSVILIFWIAYLIFNNNLNIAFWSSIVFNFLPAHLKYSGSGSADITALFFTLLSLLAILLYLKKKRLFLLYLSIPITVYSAYIKPENIVLLPSLVILLIILYRNKKIRKDDLVLLICFMGLLVVPLLTKINFMISREQINAKGAFLSLKCLIKNSWLNLQYLFDFRFHSMISTIFFIIGGIILFFQEKRNWFFLFGWFLIFYLITSAHFFGRYSLLYSADSDRHFLPSAIAFSILAGYGINVFLEKRGARVVLAVLILGLLIINSMFATERIVNYTFGRAVYKEYLYLKESTKQIPNDLYIATYVPNSIITVMNKKAVDIDLFNSMKKYPERIVLLKGFWWFENKEKSELYEKLLTKIYNFKTIIERQINNDKYGFYLLILK